jgi:hypothetical protein
MMTSARSAVMAAHVSRFVNSRGFARLGYIPDRLAVRITQQDSRELFDSSASGDVSLADFRGETLDQGQSGSCVGEGTAQILFVSASASGKPLPFFPSPRIGYGIVRILELLDASMALTDSGAMPTDMISVVPKWGIAPIGFDSQCPTPDGRRCDIWTPDDIFNLPNTPPPNINTKPNLLDLETAGLVLPVKPLRVDETSPDFGAQLTAGLNAKSAAGVGIFVDTAFMQWDPSTGPITSINTSDSNGGGHWLELDYLYTLRGKRIVGGINSWGQWNAPSSNVDSPFWKPGGWEMTLDCLQSVCSDCLIFPAVAS